MGVVYLILESVALIEASLEELPVCANLGQSCLATKIRAPGSSYFGWFRHSRAMGAHARAAHARAARHTGRAAGAGVGASEAGRSSYPTGNPSAVDVPPPTTYPAIQALGKFFLQTPLTPQLLPESIPHRGCWKRQRTAAAGLSHADGLFRPAAPAPAGAPGAPHLGEPKPGSFLTRSSLSTSSPPKSVDSLSVAAVMLRG